MTTNTKGRLVTKSVRLSPDESAFLAEVSAREHLAEGTLLRKWVLDALDRSRLELAIADYTAGELNLGEAAAQAGVSVVRMITELDIRGIDTISPAHFRASLTNLIDLFGASDELRAALAEQEK
jgi:hypothetical protein